MEINCPHCGNPQWRGERTCYQCGEHYESTELLELSHIKFLLQELEIWSDTFPPKLLSALRQSYYLRIGALRSKLTPQPTAEETGKFAEIQAHPAPPSPEERLTEMTQPESLQPQPLISETTAPAEPATPGIEMPEAPEAILLTETLPSEPLISRASEIEIPLENHLTEKPPDIIESWLRSDFLTTPKINKIESGDNLKPQQSSLQVTETLKEPEADLSAKEPQPTLPEPESLTSKTETDTPEISVSVPSAGTRVSRDEPPISFYEWLFSERNIKFALYTGAFLLMLSGVIFVSSNWGKFSGELKFAIMVLITGVFYLGGYLLYQRKELRLGGMAVLALASGFVPLNFAILQKYVLVYKGLDNDAMWLIGSFFCILIYFYTAYAAKAELFTYLGLAAIVSFLRAGLALFQTQGIVYAVIYLLLAHGLLLLAWKVQKSNIAKFFYRPLLIASQVIVPFLILGFVSFLHSPNGNLGSQLLGLMGLFLGVIFYILTNYLYGWLFAHWFAVILFPVNLAYTVKYFNLDYTAQIVGLMLTVIAYLWMSYYLERKHPEFYRKPLLFASQTLAPALILILAIKCSNLALGLAGLFLGVIFYVLTDYLYGWLVARWIAVILFPVAITCSVSYFRYDYATQILALLLTAFTYLWLSSALERKHPEFYRKPLLICSQILAPCLIVILLGGILTPDSNLGNPFIGLIGLFLGVIFYIFTNYCYPWLVARWIAVALFPIALLYAMIYLSWTTSMQILALLLTAFTYLWLSSALERKHPELYRKPLLLASQTLAPILILILLRFTIVPQDNFGNQALGLIGLFLGVIFYIFTNYCYPWLAARWIAVILFPVAATYTMQYIHWTISMQIMVLMLTAFAYLMASSVLERKEPEFYLKPLLIASQLLAPALILILLLGTLTTEANFGNPVLALTGLFLGVIFYILTNYLYGFIAPRWAAALLFPVALNYTMQYLNWSASAQILVLLLVAFAYLGGSSVLERKEPEFYFKPLLIASQLLAPVLILILLGSTLALEASFGKPIFGLAGLFLGVVFYILTNYFYPWLAARWAAIVLFPIAINYTMQYLNWSAFAQIVVLMLIAFAYLMASSVKERKEPELYLKPLLIASQLLTPVLIMILLGLNLAKNTESGDPGLVIAGLFLGVVFYIFTNYFYPWLAARWAAVVLFPIALIYTMIYFYWSDSTKIVILMLTAFAYLMASSVKERQYSEFYRRPLLIVSQVFALFLIWILLVFFPASGENVTNPVLGLAGLFLGVVYYIFTDYVYGWLAARWASAALLPATLGFTMHYLKVGESLQGIIFMLLALAYLRIGQILENKQDNRIAALPLYTVTYILAALVTWRALSDELHLIKALIGDVIILSFSAYIFKNYKWVYAAAWLFIIPAYHLVKLWVPDYSIQGLILQIIGINYLVLGYFLSRREVQEKKLPYQGGPFLTGASAINVIALVLAGMFHATNAAITTILLVSTALLYILTAIWLQWPNLLYPALIALNLAIYTAFCIICQPDWQQLHIAYAILTVIIILSALVLRRNIPLSWIVPLYLAGTFNLVCSYGLAFTYHKILVAPFSLVYAALILAFTWTERPLEPPEKNDKELNVISNISILNYFASFLIVIGCFYFLDFIGFLDYWQPFIAFLCGIFVFVSSLFKSKPLKSLYGIPLSLTGLYLAILPAVFSLITVNPILIASTFLILGLLYCREGVMRKSQNLEFIGALSMYIFYWATLVQLGIQEIQAYLVPPGIGFLMLGWIKRNSEDQLIYKLSTCSLLVLLGSSFAQSISTGKIPYAYWLFTESLACIGIGIRIKSRIYTTVGTLALIANAVVQLGPDLLTLDRWIQLAIAGTVLMGGGLAALFKREQIISRYNIIYNEWRSWRL